jgi:hypothetical protein
VDFQSRPTKSRSSSQRKTAHAILISGVRSFREAQNQSHFSRLNSMSSHPEFHPLATMWLINPMRAVITRFMFVRFLPEKHAG